MNSSARFRHNLKIPVDPFRGFEDKRVIAPRIKPVMISIAKRAR